MSSSLEKYRCFCDQEKKLPIFMKAWWLDAVCGKDNWNVIIVEQNGQIVGALPYYYSNKLIFKLILTPQLTRWLGPWISNPDNLSGRKKLSFEHWVLENLFSKLPKADWIQISCLPETKNIKSFSWGGYFQSFRYVSIVEKIKNEDRYFDELDKNTRKRILSAKNTYKIVEEIDIDTSIALFKNPYKRQNIKFTTPDSLIQNVYNISKEKGCTVILGAKNLHTQKIDSSVLCVWDNKYFYLLMSGGNIDSRKKFAKYLLTYEAIKLAWSKNLIFSFDGSMIRSIDSFNRKFLTGELYYFTLEKINSKILKLFFALK